MQRGIRLTLGAMFWLGALSAAVGSLRAVGSRAARPVKTLVLLARAGSRLATGDMVFFKTEQGLERIGEVSWADGDAGRFHLAIDPSKLDRLNASTRAFCWQTPLSTEDAIGALLPPTIQRNVASQIAASWRRYDEQVAAAWGPILGELATSFADWIDDDLEASLARHESELWMIARSHAESLVDAWPAIQERLEPILKRELAPVLARLMSEAIAEAPKVPIAWSVVRGRNDEASRRFLDWFRKHLSELSEEDQAEIGTAMQRTWMSIQEDHVLTERFADVGRRVLGDEALRDVLVDIYREAVADNPRTMEFLEREVVASGRVREQLYGLIELFAPTAQRVAARCLFDDNGATRPEIVHLVRSIALRRRVAWVTLSTPEPDASPLDLDAVLIGESAGATP